MSRVQRRTELLLRLKEKHASKDAIRSTICQLREEALLGNAQDYTAAIAALGRLGDWNQAVFLYSEYAKRQASKFQVPDDICHTSVVSTCERSSQWAAALELLFSRPVPPSAPAVAAAVGACGKGGAWQHAVSCLDGMKASKVDLNATSYGMGVSACARNHQVDASLFLLQTAHSEELEPGLLSYTSILSACRRLQRWESAVEIIATMKDRAVEPDAVCISAALSSLAFGDWQSALQLLEDAKVQAMASSRRGSLKDLRTLDVATVNAAASACETVSQWHVALCLFDEICSTSMGLGIRPDKVSFNIAISSWGQGRHWQQALNTLVEMHRMQKLPDAVSYTSAISACERALEWMQAVALLEEIKQLRLQPSVLCYGAAIGAGPWLVAFQLLEAMKADALQPSTVCFNAAISACGRSHTWEQALRLLGKMQGHDATPSIVTFNSAITCCEKGFAWNAALGLLEQARKAEQKLNVVTFGAAITACRRAMKWQSVLDLVDNMALDNLEPDAECLRVVALALFEAGQRKDAARLFREAPGALTGLQQETPRLDSYGQLDLQNLSAEAALVAARAAIDDAVTRRLKAKELIILLKETGEAASIQPALLSMIRELGLPGRVAAKPRRILVPLRAIQHKWRRAAREKIGISAWYAIMAAACEGSLNESRSYLISNSLRKMTENKASKAEMGTRNGLLSMAPWPRLQIWGPALVIFACVAAAAVTPAWPVWFWYHPAAMLLGYIALMSNAVLVKKIGGLRATKIHGYLMGAGSVAAAFGWYVIYSNKEANGKPHITTWHGLSGLICLLVTFAMSVAGTGLLDPHIGMMKSSKTVRYFHRNGGRILLATAFACSALGWSTVQKQSILPVVVFTVPLIIFMKVLI